MKVRIIGHSDQMADWWYVDRMGEEFEVKACHYNENQWKVAKGSYVRCGIRKQDAEVVRDAETSNITAM